MFKVRMNDPRPEWIFKKESGKMLPLPLLLLVYEAIETHIVRGTLPL